MSGNLQSRMIHTLVFPFAFVSLQTFPGLFEFSSNPGGFYQSCLSWLQNMGDLWCCDDGIVEFFIKHQNKRETKGKKSQIITIADWNLTLFTCTGHVKEEGTNRFKPTASFQKSCTSIWCLPPLGFSVFPVWPSLGITT